MMQSAVGWAGQPAARHETGHGQSTIRRMEIYMFAWIIEKCTTYMGVDHVHTACLAQRNHDLLVRPYLSELLSAVPFSDISSYSNILALS